MKQLTIPFSNYNNHKIVYAFINGVKSTFIIDLELEKTILNSNYFFKRVAGNTSKEPIFLSKINLYGLKPDEHLFYTQDLSEHEQDGRAIHGIFGQDILKGFQVTIAESRFILSEQNLD